MGHTGTSEVIIMKNDSESRSSRNDYSQNNRNGKEQAFNSRAGKTGENKKNGTENKKQTNQY